MDIDAFEDGTDGFFVAVFQRVATDNRVSVKKERKKLGAG